MNKTVTINISGIIFHIEEDAYEKLGKYLATIKGYFSNTEGGNEIMADIEARIAEMLQGKVSAVKQVVLMADVDAVIEVMGRPEEFAGDDHHQQNQQTNDSHSTETIRKRLYRDPDHKAIGGVCSGIAAYFDVDIIWIRLAMFLLTFAAGMSIWVYLILWIVIPEAKTTAEKLAMRGEKIDVNSISRTVMEEADQIKKRMEKYGNDIRYNAESRNFFDKLADFLKECFGLFGRIFLRLIGLLLLFFGVSALIPLLATIFGISFIDSNSTFNNWLNVVFQDRSQYYLAIVGMLLCAGIPVLMMIYGGAKLLFKIYYTNRWLNLSAGLLWLCGFIMCIYVASAAGNAFSDDASIPEAVAIKQYDTLYLKLNNNSEMLGGISFRSHVKKKTRRGNVVIINENEGGYKIGGAGDSKFIAAKASLKIEPSSSDKFELFVVKTSRGEDAENAQLRAKAIRYKVTQSDSLILLDQLFSILAKDKFRFQEVEVLLKVPRGKVIHLDNNMETFIKNTTNLSNALPMKMADRRWVMTKDGLQCIDCDGLEESVLPEPPPLPILDIEDKDAKVKIDHNGIDIKSKDANVTIGKDGIHVESKESKKH